MSSKPLTVRRLDLIAAFLLGLFSLFSLPQASGMDLVANVNTTAESVTRNEARLLFLMRRAQWPDGQPVQVFVLPDENSSHQAFCKQKLFIFPRKLRLAWERQLYSGTGQVPIRVNSLEEMLQRVGSTPGAVGYLPENMTNDRVKILPIR